MHLSSDLIKKIESTPRRQKTFIIGVDGFGGSGKSTFAKLLKDHFKGATIVEMDDFYSPPLKRADYQRVNREVLIPLLSDTPASYRVYEWKTDTMSEPYTIEPGGVVIIEGIYSTNNEMRDAYDFKIWVECPQEVGIERGIARDVALGDTEIHNKWIKEWMPLEKEYADIHNPRGYADYIVDGTK